MKKLIFVFILWLLLAWCSSKAEIDSAKQELLENTPEQITASTDNTDVSLNEDETEVIEEDSLVQIIALDANSPLDFNNISEESLNTGEVVISWVAGPDVDTIEVFFTNPNSTFSDDRYTLQTYVKWEWDFKYIASSKNKVLDFGVNEYIFRAYSGTAENETKVVLTVPADTNSQEIDGNETQLIWWEDDSLLIDLPVSTTYGEPLMLWEDSFTYTQIKGLEIEKQVLSQLSCDDLTEFLTERLNTWYYWNTCRDIVNDKGIKFNVIRLDTWVDKDTIADKNDELKEKTFPTIQIVDGLIRDILNA